MTDQTPIQIALTQDASALLEEVETLLSSVLAQQTFEQDENVRIFVLAHCARMLRFATGMRILTKAGIVDAAGALLRTILEQGYVLGAIREDPLLLKDLAAQQHGEARKAFNGLRDLASEIRGAEVSNENIESALSKLVNGSGFNAYFWAAKSGYLDSYHTRWRTLSALSHGGAGATTDYIEMDATEFVHGFKTDVAGASAADFLTMAASLLLDAADAVCGENLSSNERTAYAALQSRLSELSARAGVADELSKGP